MIRTKIKMTTPNLTAIVAATTSNGIGLNGGLPWRLPGEMKYFAKGKSCHHEDVGPIASCFLLPASGRQP